MNLLCDTGNQTDVSGSEIPFFVSYFNAISLHTGSNKILFLGQCCYYMDVQLDGIMVGMH